MRIADIIFEGFMDHGYFYQGIVRLNGEPFQKKEKDQSGSLQKVWKFPLELCDGDSDWKKGYHRRI